jgi:hydrogenase maturation protease
MSARACVLALGQFAAGDDGVGWAVLDEVRTHAPSGVELVRTTDALVLTDHLQTAGLVILVDAVLAPPPGRVLLLDVDDLAAQRACSTHALPVADAVALGRALSPACAHVNIVAITIDRPIGPTHALSPVVAAAVRPAAERVLDLLRART